MDSLMESLDTDGDSECDFQEFMTFITMVTICCHEFFEHHEDEWVEFNKTSSLFNESHSSS